MAPKVTAPVKRARLTLSQLASYDDILTDALVDHVYYWAIIRKNRAKYNLTRGFSEEQVTDILRNDLIVDRDPQKAEQKLLKLFGIKRFLERLKTKKEQEDFKRHLRKYIGVWSNDCPFEISTTNRYTIVSHEAAVVARRVIEKGETIKYLCGNLVSMTPDEEKDLGLTRRDFSIVMSSRKKTPSLFLGPARFANHDCNANARLVTTGPDGMQVVALRTIVTNEEITVTYGEDYFGVDNCECLCKTCEDAERNGWAKGSTSPKAKVVAATMNEFAPYSLRRARRVSNSGISTPKLLTPEASDSAPLKRRRSESTDSARKRSKLNTEISSPLPDTNSLPPEGGAPTPISPQIRAISCDDEATNPTVNELAPHISIETERPYSAPPVQSHLSHRDAKETETRPEPTEANRPKYSGELKAISFRTSLLAPKPESAQISLEPSDTESIFDLYGIRKSSDSHWDTPPSISIASWCNQADGDAVDEDVPRFSLARGFSDGMALDDTRNSIDHVATDHNDDRTESASGQLSPSLAEETAQDDTSVGKKANKIDGDRRLKKLHSLGSGLRAMDQFSLGAVDPFDPRLQQRRPGDYVRTPILLSAPYSRWVDCRTCTGTWVQSDGYLTRRECPRCERHSKLYGYAWPKTERGQLSWKGGRPGRPGKQKRKKSRPNGHNEERVLDHRTVHRFIDARQEKAEHRKGHGLEPPTAEILAALAATPEVSESEDSMDESSSGRKTGKASKFTLKKGANGRVKGSTKGKVVALLKRRPSSTTKSHILTKTLSALQKKKSSKAGKGLGRTKNANSKIASKRKASIFDYPSDSEDERALAKSIRKKKATGKKAQDAKNSINGKKGKGKLKSPPKPKRKLEPVKRVPNPRPGWRGWVELNEDETRPVTLEQSMELANSTGTRRGTQLGR